jgi:pyrroloquinoline quinone biosynthesis protein E
MLLYPERGLALNATSHAIVQMCDGTRTAAEIAGEIRERFTDVPPDVEAMVAAFLGSLAARGLVSGIPAGDAATAAPSEDAAPRPYTLIAELTYKCPLQCLYCSNPLDLRAYTHELATADWTRILAQAEEAGVVQIHFTGGEPLVRKDLDDLVAQAAKLSLYSNLVTGGEPLSEGRLERLVRLGLSALQVSIQDVDPDGARFVSNRARSDEKIRLMEAGKALGLPVTMNVVLHRQNMDRVAAFAALAEGVGVDRLELANTQYLGWALANRELLMPTEAQVDAARDIAAAAKARLRGKMDVLFVKPDHFGAYPRACMDGWARRFLHVTPTGIALPCHAAMTLPMAFPDLRAVSVQDAWNSPAFERFRGQAWMNEPCRSCDRRGIDFGGCRCQAFLLTGDLDATDPACSLSKDHTLVSKARLVRAPATADARRLRVF